MNAPRPAAEGVLIPPAQGFALVGGLIGLAMVAALALGAGATSQSRWFVEPHRLAFSYLTALLFLTTIGVGSLAWLMLHHLTGAVWSVALRRLLENLTQPLPWLVLLFIPVATNLSLLYPWADSSRVSADPELARKTVWLNPVLFDVRMAVYLACWILLASNLARRSARQDRRDAPASDQAMKSTSAWGMLVLGLTTSLAAFDWLMTLDPHWSSTIFGVYFWAGSLVSSLAALVVVALGLRALGWLRTTITVEHLHDMGKLLFGFVIFWAYIAFSQYFLIWYANFPEETGWYVTRRFGTWNTMSWALVVGHFVVPFFVLLFRATKRNPYWLGFISVWILVFHYIDLYWLIMPAFRAEGALPHWLDASLVLTLTFICAAIIAYACQRRPLVPIGDPRLAESIAFRGS
ncbi:MAG: hypothetical protein ACLQIB_19090 [Isosphaeraceae bacterium]